MHEDFEKCLREACMWASSMGHSYYVIQDDLGGCWIPEYPGYFQMERLPERQLWDNPRYKVYEITPQLGAARMKDWEKQKQGKKMGSRSHEECDNDTLDELHPDDFDRWMKVAELAWRMAAAADINLETVEPHPTPYRDRPIATSNTKQGRVRVVIRRRNLGHHLMPGKWHIKPIAYSEIVDGLIDALATLRFNKNTEQWDWAKEELGEAAILLVKELSLDDADVSVSAQA